MKNQPILLVFAGPNGSGKSTVTAYYTPTGYYVNADEIQKYLGCSTLEAAQTAEATREHLLSQNEDFTFETVLSTERNYNLMERARKNGYIVKCIFILTNNPEINVARVNQRVQNGGHDVPAQKIRTRYCRALTLFPRLFDICNEIYVYDNSLDRSEGEPSLVLQFQNGALNMFPSPTWTYEMLVELIEG